MGNNSTNINKIPQPHLTSNQWTQKRPWIMKMDIQVPVLDRPKIVK